MPRRQRVLMVGVAMSALAAGLVVAPNRPSSAQTAPTPAPNPPIADSCGVDVTLVLDASGSISSSGAVEDVRSAADAFLDALRGTSSSARVTQFGTASEQLAPLTLVDDASLGTGGALSGALTRYYDPQPPAPTGRVFRQYDGSGSPTSSSNWGAPNTTQIQYTNWDQALDAARTPADLVVFVTDGDPTAYDLDQAGDPFGGTVIGYNTNRGDANAPTINRAIDEANDVKSSRRMLAVGVGAALSNPASVTRLTQVSGPLVVRDAQLGSVTSLNQVDVALVTEFDRLAQFLRGVVLQLCSPSLTIRKLAQSATSADYLPAPGWSMTVTPSALPPGTGFRWILPDTTAAVSKTSLTDANGFAQFQWEPTPPEANTQAIVQEALLPGYTAGRPGIDNDFRCEFRDDTGTVRTVSGDFPATGAPTFTLNPIGQDIGTCTVWNSFNFVPAINVTKLNAPTAVRGDLDPPVTVTSSYAVTIPSPGNTPLRNVTVTDDKCGPVEPVPPGGNNVGDTNGNGLLDLPETWQFTCTRSIGGGTTPTTIVNTATARGTDPANTTVSDTAIDDVDVYIPEITLTKLVDGEERVIVTSGTAVTYTYEVENTGSTPLGTVTLDDDTPPCNDPANRVRGPDSPGNDDATLDVGETWNFACTANPTTDVVNIATVVGTPLNPGAANAPFPDPNPVVDDQDFAEVDVINPNIELTKSVTPTVVLLDPDGAAEPVTYTFQAENTGTPALNRPNASTGGPGPKDPGWVVDLQCTSPATYVSGDLPDDTTGNDLLDPVETWIFTCGGLVSAPTVNIAGIVGQPSNPDGSPIGSPPVFDLAVAFVTVLQPGIDITKTALVPVVLDENIVPPPVIGPDAPGGVFDPRPAEYLYEVTNSGNVELDVTPDPPTDPLCTPLVFDPTSDDDADGLLDVDETWVYTCARTLDRERDGNTPPVTGDESGLVTNTVSVTGVPSFGTPPELFPGKAVSATDIAQVLVIEPGISLTKTASAPVVRLGGSVTYTFVVSNPGDVGLDVVGPADDECSPLEFIGGDTNDNGLLDGADSGAQESWTYECTRAVFLPEPPATTDINTATVLGIDPLGNVYEADDTAVVRVFDPRIRLTKTVSDSLVLNGTDVTYGFEVVNVGESPLAADDVLAEITLIDVSLPPVPSCLEPTFVGGDTDGDGLLPRAPAEVWTYTCSATITEPTTDVAVVRGTGGTLFQPPLPIDVLDIAAAFVQPFTPAIEATKSAAPTLVVGSGPVTYTYLVRNTGDVPLGDVASRVVDDTCSPVTYASGDEDGDGLLDTPNSIFEDSLEETWTFTCTVAVSATTTNTVVVAGTPTDPDGTPLCANGVAGEARQQVVGPCDVTDDAVAIVTVVAPGAITIIKRTPAATSDTFDFTIGSETFSLPRDGVRDVGNVAPGAYTVTEATEPGWQLASLECTDATGDSVVTVAERQAVVNVAPGETVTCTFTNRRSGTLPATGNSDLLRILLFALLMAGLGASLVLVDRQRRPTAR